ncbi:MAG: NEAT domain-containing protein [Eubacteriales bacterium]|nr:NEAT domain-containing protein [Eubacteriales bacterium]
MKRVNGLRRMRLAAMAACLSATMLSGQIGMIGTALRRPSATVARAEEAKMNEGLKLLEPDFMPEGEYMEGKLRIGLEKEGHSGSYYPIFEQIAKIKVDDKYFEFNPMKKSDTFNLRDNYIVDYNSSLSNATNHFKKQEKHKIVVTFLDGSQLIYEDQDYVKPADADPDEGGAVTPKESGFAGKRLIKEAKVDDYGELLITPESGYEAQAILDQLTALRVNGVETPAAELSKKWDGSLRAYDSAAAVKAWKKDGANQVELVFADGVSQLYTTGAATPQGPEQPQGQDQQTPDASWAGKEMIKKAGPAGYGDELEFVLLEDFSAKEVFEKLIGIRINGTVFGKEKFRLSYGDRDIRTAYEGAQDAVGAWKMAEDNKVELIFADGESMSYPKAQSQQPDAPTEEPQAPKKMVKVSKDMANGVYTLGFDALYADGREGSSMLAGFFDKNIKLEVTDGKMKITMLNTLFAHGLLEFAVQNKGQWVAMSKENFGEPNSTGQYDRALFSMEIEDLDQLHLAGVIVSYMGGLETDKGNYDRYTKVKLQFSEEAAEGFDGYDIVETEKKARAASSALLQKKLKAKATDSEGRPVNNVDADGNGEVTAEELNQFQGIIDIGDLVIDGAIDKGAIYDLTLLKNMGPGVTEFRSGSNVLGELPEDLFAKAVNIKKINLGGNKITKLPAKIFANNPKLEDVNISANALGELSPELFAGNPALKSIQIDNAWLASLSEQQFANNPKLTEVGLSSNKLTALPEQIFANNPNITFVGLRDNELTALPSSLGSLKKLRTLDFTNNRVQELPADFGGLTAIEYIHAKNNELTGLADEVWATLAKNQGRVNLVGNNLKELPLKTIQAAGSLAHLEVAGNYLPIDFPYTEEEAETLGITPTGIQEYYPQKTAVSFEVVAKDGTISYAPQGDLTILNLLHWFTGRSAFSGGEGILQGIDKYREFIKSKNEPLDQMLIGPDYSLNWEIVTRIERIRQGVATEISAETVKNADDTDGLVKDPAMEKGDVYRVTKELYRRAVTGDMERLFAIPTEVEADIAESNQSDIKAYRVPISLRQASSDQLSMGNGALEQEAYVEVNEKTGKTDITMTFKPMFLEKFNATGHLTKLGSYATLEDMRADKNLMLAEVLETYTDEADAFAPQAASLTEEADMETVTGPEASKKSFPKKVRISRAAKGEPEIGIKVWVDMMDELAKLSGKDEGPQPAVLQVDWDKAEEIKIAILPAPQPQPQPDTPADDQTPDSNGGNDQQRPQPPVQISEENGVKKYRLPVSLINSVTGAPSMGAKALEELADIEEKEGSVAVTLTFKPLYLAAFKATGHLTRLGIYPSLEDMKAKANMKDAEVIETYEENGVTYPKKVRFTLAKKGERDTGARVWVDMMDEIARQGGQEDGSQSVIIRLDWSGVALQPDGTKKPSASPVQPLGGRNQKNPTTGEAPLWAPLAGLAVSAAASAAAVLGRRRKK